MGRQWGGRSAQHRTVVRAREEHGRLVVRHVRGVEGVDREAVRPGHVGRREGPDDWLGPRAHEDRAEVGDGGRSGHEPGNGGLGGTGARGRRSRRCPPTPTQAPPTTSVTLNPTKIMEPTMSRASISPSTGNSLATSSVGVRIRSLEPSLTTTMAPLLSIDRPRSFGLANGPTCLYSITLCWYRQDGPNVHFPVVRKLRQTASDTSPPRGPPPPNFPPPRPPGAPPAPPPPRPPRPRPPRPPPK